MCLHRVLLRARKQLATRGVHVGGVRLGARLGMCALGAPVRVCDSRLRMAARWWCSITAIAQPIDGHIAPVDAHLVAQWWPKTGHH